MYMYPLLNPAARRIRYPYSRTPRARRRHQTRTGRQGARRIGPAFMREQRVREKEEVQESFFFLFFLFLCEEFTSDERRACCSAERHRTAPRAATSPPPPPPPPPPVGPRRGASQLSWLSSGPVEPCSSLTPHHGCDERRAAASSIATVCRSCRSIERSRRSRHLFAAPVTRSTSMSTAWVITTSQLARTVQHLSETPCGGCVSCA